MIVMVLIVLALLACVWHAINPTARPLWPSVLLLVLAELLRLVVR